MIPRKFHFIYVSRGDRPVFGLMHYAAIKSAIDLNRPEKVFYHCNVEPEGEFWEKIRPLVEIVHTEVPAEIQGNKISNLAHAVDILRLEALKEYGGIYMDLDTICVRPFKSSLYKCKCVLGLELNPGWSALNHLKKIVKAAAKLHFTEMADKVFNFREHKYMGFGNAVIMAEKDSLFIERWLESYANFNSDHWNMHSVIMPFRVLYKRNKKLVKALGYKAFYYPLYKPDGLAKLFETDKGCRFDKAIVHHLWANVSYDKYIENSDPGKTEGLSYYESLLRKYI
jgi:hypothetical protein